jgi:hypothetical protein
MNRTLAKRIADIMNEIDMREDRVRFLTEHCYRDEYEITYRGGLGNYTLTEEELTSLTTLHQNRLSQLNEDLARTPRS